MQDGGTGAGAQHGGALREANLIFVLPPNVYMGPPGGGLFGFKFSSRPHPRKFGVKRFLAVRRSWRGNGVDCFGLPPWKKFSAARPRPSRSAQEDGCSSLPCRGVLSFRSEAREASGSETARLHQARWRRSGGVAGRGASAAAGDADDRRSRRGNGLGWEPVGNRLYPAASRARLDRGPHRRNRISLGGRTQRAFPRAGG